MAETSVAFSLVSYLFQVAYNIEEASMTHNLSIGVQSRLDPFKTKLSDQKAHSLTRLL